MTGRVHGASSWYQFVLHRLRSKWAVVSQLLQGSDWGRLGKVDVLFVRHDNDCGELIEGQFYSPLLDSIADELPGVTRSTVALPFSRNFGRKTYSNALSFNGAFAREILWRRLCAVIGAGPSAADLRTWRRILSAARPRFVLSIQPSGSLCRAAHENGSVVLDIQHGYIGPNNPGYGASFQAGKDRLEMADCILCWDEASAESLQEWTSRFNVELRVIGNPWIHKFMMAREDDPVLRFLRALDRTAKRSDVRARVLVSLQWGLSDEVATPNQELFDNEFMPIALAKAIHMSQDQFCWVLRPHPAQRLDAETFERLSGWAANFLGSAVRLSGMEPLPLILSEVDLHVTYNSSVVIEAALFGVRSAVLDPQVNGGIWDGYFAHQIAAGMADLVQCNSEAIVAWLHDATQESGVPEPRQSPPHNYLRFLDDVRTMSRDGHGNARQVVPTA